MTHGLDPMNRPRSGPSSLALASGHVDRINLRQRILISECCLTVVKYSLCKGGFGNMHFGAILLVTKTLSSLQVRVLIWACSAIWHGPSLSLASLIAYYHNLLQSALTSFYRMFIVLVEEFCLTGDNLIRDAVCSSGKCTSEMSQLLEFLLSTTLQTILGLFIPVHHLLDSGWLSSAHSQSRITCSPNSAVPLMFAFIDVLYSLSI